MRTRRLDRHPLGPRSPHQTTLGCLTTA
jgi:hypothetical protein